MNAPSAAECARTAVACALTGTLTTFPRQASPLRESVSVLDDNGRVVLALSSHSPAAQLLSVRPFACLRIAPAGWEPTVLQGAVRRLPRAVRSPITRFTLDPGTVRLGGAHAVPVELEAYRTAHPDPLRHEAPGIIAHLRRDHGHELTECLRAQGHHRVLWAEATRLDRHGLELAAVEAHGVRSVRLSFPQPVNDLRELGPSLYLALRAGCVERLHRRRTRSQD